jgi:RNA polymerase sigma-70 factor (ECF subfamily)
MAKPGHPPAVGIEEDLELARRCAAAEPQAACDLVARYGPFLRRVAERSLPSRSEDVVAEVFLRLFEDDAALLRAYRGEANLRAYLAGVCRRVALETARREALRSGIPLLEIEDAAPVDPWAPRLEWLSRALTALPERDRSVLSLRYQQGLSFREIAATLGVPLGTAASWVARARERLRALWEAEYGKDKYPA